MGTTYCPDGERAVNDNAGSCTLYGGNTEPGCCCMTGGICCSPFWYSPPAPACGRLFWYSPPAPACGMYAPCMSYETCGTYWACWTYCGCGAYCGKTAGCTYCGVCWTYCGGKCMTGGMVSGAVTRYGVPATRLEPLSDRDPYAWLLAASPV